MATKLKRSDILMKHKNRGRPPKPVKERLSKQRAAYQWRDARRIYLAGSFEPWRKLKNRLQLKDSSLAWHLLEAHDKGCSICSTSDMSEKEENLAGQKLGDINTCFADLKKNTVDFHQVLVTQLRQMCYKYLEFEDYVHVVGLICLDTDCAKKDRYTIDEVVKRGLQPKKRTFELSQSQHETSENESVATVLSKFDKRDGNCDIIKHGAIETASQGGASSHEALKKHTGSCHITKPVVSSSLQGQSCVTSMTCDIFSKALPADESESDLNSRGLLHQKQHRDGISCQQSASGTVPMQSHLYDTHQNYDETDYSTQSVSSQHADLNSLAPSVRKVHTVSDHSHIKSNSLHVTCTSAGSHRQRTDHCISYKPGETNKVVVSEDGVVSHVVQNGSVVGQVYRVDLSKQDENMDIDVQSPVSCVTHGEDVQIGDGEIRDRAASMESNDSFKEVGIISGIKHAQRLLDSPTDHSKSSPVSDLPEPTNPDTCPHPSDHSSANFSLPTDSVCPYPESSSLPKHTSVIKQVCLSENSAALKPESATSSCDASLSAEKFNTPLISTSVCDGDIPLDMSVKDDEDYTDDGSEYASQRKSSKTVSYSQHEFSHESEAVCNNAASPSYSMASSRELSQKSATSSMQLLQLYTNRMLMQEEVTSDLSPVHGSLLDDEPTISRKRTLSDMTDDRIESEISKGVFLPRKYMNQKEEYQYLESDPFMDFGEMTRTYHNMQQRTFYRWKRRIKDQYMSLEQRPEQTYAQFSRFHPSVREHVFKHWQDLIAQGHRFLGDAGKSSSTFNDLSWVADNTQTPDEGESSGANKEEESGPHSDNFVSQYIFLQKHPGLDAEQFLKLYPEVPEHLFYMWQKQIISEYITLQTNPKMTYQEFRKQASVTQDVFSLWKAQLNLMNNPAHLISTCSSLVTASSSLNTATPTLPPVSLLAGNKKIGADLAAWYASYMPFMGQVAQFPFWSPLSIMSSSSLASSFPNIRDNPIDDQEPSKEQLCTDKITERSQEKDCVKKKKLPEPSKPDESEAKSDIEKASGVETVNPYTSEGGGNGEGPLVYRGRRQSLKPEHNYFLRNPDTPYLALANMYPDVSAQRYGRWRRKVSSALAFLEREPGCTDEEFALSFPNVPDEILLSWRERVAQGRSRLTFGNDDASLLSVTTHRALANSQEQSKSPSPVYSSQGPDTASTTEDIPNFLTDRSRDADSDRSSEDNRDQAHHELQLGTSPRKQFKANRKEYFFFLCHPTIDFPTFSAQHPHISARTFYRWRRQIFNNMDKLLTSPAITLLELQKLDPEITEDVFKIWSSLVREKSKFLRDERAAGLEKSGNETGMEAEGLELLSHLSQSQEALQSKSDGAAVQFGDQAEKQAGLHTRNLKSSSQLRDQNQCHLKQEEKNMCRPEQHLVHMNPYLDYSTLSHTYPEVSQRTFYRWRQEVHHAMKYMRECPDVSFAKIASVLPICQEAFLLWQQMIRTEKVPQQNTHRTEAESTNHSTDVLSAQGNSGNGDLSSSQTASETLSSDDYDNSARKQVCSDMNRLIVPETADQYLGIEVDDGSASKVRRQTRDEFIGVMVNPAMDYAEFQHRFGTVSQRTFYRWRAHIREWRALIRADPHLDYATFSRSARDVPEYVFNLWREWESSTENTHNAGTSLDSYEVTQHEHSFSTAALSTRGPVTLSTFSETNQLDSNQSKVLWMAYDYCHTQPDINFEDLSSIFPSVTREVFEQWQKGLGFVTEYIRSIPTTNFQDFHRLFPDIKEHVFKVLKEWVLSRMLLEKNFLMTQTTDSESPSTLPSLNSAYSSGSAYTVANDVQTGSTNIRHNKVPGAFSGHGSSETTQLSLYENSEPVSQSPHMHSDHGMTSDSALNAGCPSSVQVKQEASPNTPLPSFTETVSNLGRLSAMIQHHLPRTKAMAPATPPQTAVSYSQASVIASTPASIGDAYSTALAGILGNSFPKVSTSSSHSLDSAQMYQLSNMYSSLPVPSTSHVTIASSHVPEDCDVNVSEIGQQGCSSLETQNNREDRGTENLVHSSQRQRKLQRVEYMFVEQNPDVDVQEFLTRFPKVSLRTFYRWKREIREEQMAGAGNNNLL